MKYEKRHTRRKKPSMLPVYFDLIILIGTIGGLIYANYTIDKLGMLPTMYMVILGLVTFAICLVFAILMIVQKHWWSRLIKNIIALSLVIGSIYLAGSIDYVDNAMNTVLEVPTSSTEYVTVVVRKDSGILSAEELAGKKVAVQKTMDKDHMQIAMDELSKFGLNEEDNFYYYDDYISAVKNLYDGFMDAMVISENYRDIIEDNYEDFASLTSRIEAYEIEVPVTAITKNIDVTTNAFTVLISGIDTIGKPSQRENSDSNMLIVVNPLTTTVTMISIPRDSLVPNACLNNEDDKLTAAGRQGVGCLIDTVENYFDIDIDYYARISFSSVIDVVNTLGGIEVDVPMSFCERPSNRSYAKNDIIYVEKGLQTLNGEQALALARHRKTVAKGDLGRAKNQQLVVNAIIKKALSTATLTKLDSLMQVVNNTVQTNFTKKEIYAFVNTFLTNPTEWTFSNNVVSGTTGFAYTATVPGLELSIVNLSEEEVRKVKYIIRNAESADLSDLTFSINEITTESEEELTAEGEGETEGAGGGDYCHLN